MSRLIVASLLLPAALAAASVRAAPDPAGAAVALLRTPLRVAGDLTGGATQIGAAGVALLGDGISLVDRNRVTRRVLFGGASRTVQAVAFGVAWTGSQTLQLLRWEDIERLPQPPAAYIDTARTAGRFDAAIGGLASLGLGLRDALLGTNEALLRLAGANGAADALARNMHDARVRALGPEPLPALAPKAP